MADVPLQWGAETLWLQLGELLPGLSIEVVERCSSTNTMLLERARVDLRAETDRSDVLIHRSVESTAFGRRAADTQPCLLVAEHQTGGRGRKLAGVLIATVSAGAVRLAVIGVGLNILPLPAAELGTGFACLQELDADASAPGALHRLALPLVRALREFESGGFAACAAAYARRDLLANQSVSTTQQGAPEGVARGVDSSGALRLETPQGLIAIHSGEVSVRLAPDA